MNRKLTTALVAAALTCSGCIIANPLTPIVRTVPTPVHTTQPPDVSTPPVPDGACWASVGALPHCPNEDQPDPEVPNDTIPSDTIPVEESVPGTQP